MMVNVGEKVEVEVGGRKMEMRSGSLLVAENSGEWSMNWEGEQFLLINYIGCVDRR